MRGRFSIPAALCVAAALAALLSAVSGRRSQDLHCGGGTGRDGLGAGGEPLRARRGGWDVGLRGR